MKALICFCISIFLYYSSYAQAPVHGCLIGAAVHTAPDDLGLINVALVGIFGGTAAYKNSPTEPQTSACVNFSQTVWTNPAGACRVCPNGYNVLNLVTGCSGTANNGFIVTKSIVYCNLDDYTLPLAAAAGTLGLLVIRRRRHN